MSRSTIDFGIDLGTTNSAIAVLNGITAEIVKNNQDADITPSVVGFDKRGALRVGAQARDLMGSDPDDAFGEFKRRMGTDQQYAFKRSGHTRKPEELSAEVLKALRGDVRQRLGEDVVAAVITVPAAFQLHQCDATRKAAEQAGLLQSPLLQEPVAAALAYGFQGGAGKEHWLVYDFGGGTFDAAIVKAEEGTVRVVNHGGDNFLGGSDIDWSLIDKVIAPRWAQDHGLDEFHRGNPRWRTAFALLKRSVERAKIRVSREDAAWLEDCRFRSESDEILEPDFELTRLEVIRAAEPIIARSVEICRRVLAERQLAAGSIARMILVGGPTLAPYFREQLTQSLGIPLEHGVDPLTVVARGAAVFAGAQRTVEAGRALTEREYRIDLKHNPVGPDSDPLVGGRVTAPTGTAVTGVMLELTEEASGWRSGRLPVSAEGAFVATLRAERGRRNVYSIALFDSAGNRQRVAPDSLSYTVGAVVDEQHLINSMGVALANNDFDCMLERGRSLPAKVTRIYASNQPVRKGERTAALRIPVCEGQASRADRNRHVGTLVISADELSRDLPVNSEIEVTLEIDASRIAKVRAYVPILDGEFEATLSLGATTRSAQEIREAVAEELQRLDETIRGAREVAYEEGAQGLEAVRDGALVTEIQGLLAVAGNSGAAEQCEQRLLELKRAIDAVADRLEHPKVLHSARVQIRQILEEVGLTDREDLKKQAQSTITSLQRAMAADDIEGVRTNMKEATQVYYQLLRARPSYWVASFEYVQRRVDMMSNPTQANRLAEQGRAFLSQGNIDGLRNVVVGLWALMPQTTADESAGAFASSLYRKWGV